MNRPLPIAELESSVLELPASRPRAVVLRTSGTEHGPINRLVSPSDIGGLIKPFVFLDHAAISPGPKPLFGIHPHSGIATVTVVLGGGLEYEDTTGKVGSVPTGGVEWMKAGMGVWHDGRASPGEPLRLFQLWLALPAAEENGPPESQYLPPAEIQADGPARVIIGRYGRASSSIRAPAGINYLHVRLPDGASWRYAPPEGQNVAWLAVDRGQLRSPEPIDVGQVAVFEESTGAIALTAVGDTSFVLGSAVKHPSSLVLGRYSVHTSAAALARGEAEILRIGARLRAEGRL